MKINGVVPNQLVDLYSKSSGRVESKTLGKLRDSIEISSLGKSLSDLEIEIPNVNNDEKVKRIKKEIEEGTYNVDATLTAQKLIDFMKGRGV